MGSTSGSRIIVAISGGVDSAVAALLLLEAGHAVEGLHMTNWSGDDEYCSAAEDLQAARAVCKDLGIPLHHVNFSREYRQKVFEDFLAELRAGRTPNPDIACNREIKFGDCLRFAHRLGAQQLATGHYARTVVSDDAVRLLKAVDRSKDQSYFLADVPAAAFRDVLFPLGSLTKAEVRAIAHARGLPNFARRDSTGICFIGERPFETFLAGFIEKNPGRIVTPDGECLGEHQGLMYYTLGQRQGLHIGGQRQHGPEPWYVAAKNFARNELVVVQGRLHPLLWQTQLACEHLNWFAAPAAAVFRCAAKTRYRQQDVACTVRLAARPGDPATVEFDEPVWAITPGQQVVFYQDDDCLGGGRIIEQSPGGDRAFPLVSGNAADQGEL